VGRREDDTAVRWCVSEPLLLFEGGMSDNTRGILGPETSGQISSMAMDGDSVWVASGSHAIRYLRGKEVQSSQSSTRSCFLWFSWLICEQVSRLSNPFDAAISHITIVGTQVLALSEDGGRMFIWETTNAGKDLTRSSLVPSDIRRTELQSTIEFDVGFSAVSVLHPATYLNKVLVASSQGSLQLWNIRTRLVPFAAS
jgi:U3 small nucleolar RNA-associated protein 21